VRIIVLKDFPFFRLVLSAAEGLALFWVSWSCIKYLVGLTSGTSIVWRGRM